VQCAAFIYSVLQCKLQYCSVRCSVLQGALQCVAVYVAVSVAVCCSVGDSLTCSHANLNERSCCSELQ